MVEDMRLKIKIKITASKSGPTFILQSRTIKGTYKAVPNKQVRKIALTLPYKTHNLFRTYPRSAISSDKADTTENISAKIIADSVKVPN
jgi:hypothetical protein